MRQRYTAAEKRAADFWVDNINKLTHTKGPFARETFSLRPWQEHDIIRPLFGRLRPTGLRRIRTALIMMPRKNGKSELGAALGIGGLLWDGEIGADVFIAAADRDQASLIYHVAIQMIRNDPELEAECEIIESQKRIVHRKSGSVLRAISAEAYSKHGFNASMVIYDELHAAPNRDLWDVLATSQGARAQPLMIAISTAGYNKHSILWELYNYACKVRDGQVEDETFLPVIYEATKDVDWMDEAVWRAANPALGDFRSLEEMQIMARRAKEVPGEENAFRRLYLNQWTEQAERWIQMVKWDQCQGVIDERELVGADCIVGLDLANTTDIAAAVLLFPMADGRLIVKPHFWVPEEGMRRRAQTDRVPYDVWTRQGMLTATPGAVIDYAVIRADLNRMKDRYAIRQIAFDPWNAEGIRQQLETDGFVTVKVPQQISFLNEPTKRLGDAVVSRTLVHDGNPVLRWMASNMVVRLDDNANLKPDKAKSSEKIDGIVALIIAMSVWLREPVVPEPKYQAYILGAR